MSYNLELSSSEEQKIFIQGFKRVDTHLEKLKDSEMSGDTGIKVDFLHQEESIMSNSKKVWLVLHLVDPKKRVNRGSKTLVAIEIEVDLEINNCDERVESLFKMGVIFKEDMATIAMLIQEKILYLKNEREKRETQK